MLPLKFREIPAPTARSPRTWLAQPPALFPTQWPTTQKRQEGTALYGNLPSTHSTRGQTPHRSSHPQPKYRDRPSEPSYYELTTIRRPGNRAPPPADERLC